MLQEAVKQLSAEGINIKIRRIDVVPLSEASTRRQWLNWSLLAEREEAILASILNTMVVTTNVRKANARLGYLKAITELATRYLDSIMKNLARYKGV
ncbi:hypothetical protein [Thiomicrorhabdus indica]|uniref:hypothetical protein n=1 Tax=Thiomicrorhabdus indica TaxID=2267253 RepID=UPI00102D8B1A|nr:hypothetical protein [Thiomicrorhabdus indica]